MHNDRVGVALNEKYFYSNSTVFVEHDIFCREYFAFVSELEKWRLIQLCTAGCKCHSEAHRRFGYLSSVCAMTCRSTLSQ